MKRLLIVSLTLLVSLIFVSCSRTEEMAPKQVNAAGPAAPAAPNKAAAESEIKNKMTEIAKALAANDTASLEKYYGDEFYLVNPDGSVQNKTERINSIKTGELKYESFRYDDTTIRFNPEVNGAVVITRATLKSSSKGKTLDGQLRVTQVWGRTPDGWKIYSGHATKIEAPEENK